MKYKLFVLALLIINNNSNTHPIADVQKNNNLPLKIIITGGCILHEPSSPKKIFTTPEVESPKWPGQ